MKFLAFYLPQYHEIKENNEWWGKGFTDWVNVKNARAYYQNQRQPRIPLNGYYDLSNTQDIQKQVDLANKYGVFGFCIYHYWFNGHLLLEKPVQLILDNPNININFCFSWANENWTRVWNGKGKKLLIKQEYGDKRNWQEHFDYFLQFFKDKRYIRVANKPMLLIYKLSDIPNVNEMLNLWDNLARKNGFDGLYIVNTIRTKKDKVNHCFHSSNAEFEPSFALSQMPKIQFWYRRFRRIIIRSINQLFKTYWLENAPFSFKCISRIIANTELPSQSFYGICTGWDNTPRRKTSGTIIQESTPEEFEELLKIQIEKTQQSCTDEFFVFINAWNEWAEGTYLEPDTENRYKYLEVLRKYTVSLDRH